MQLKLRALTLSPVGLSPTEHASLRWTHSFAIMLSDRKTLMCNSLQTIQLSVIKTNQAWKSRCNELFADVAYMFRTVRFGPRTCPWRITKQA
jgi:hypothetical protein